MELKPTFLPTYVLVVIEVTVVTVVTVLTLVTLVTVVIVVTAKTFLHHFFDKKKFSQKKIAKPL